MVAVPLLDRQRFATLEANILNQLATLTAAPVDEATVAQWLQGERNANGLVAQAAKAGKRGNLKRYLRLLTQSISVAGQANQIVAGCGFQVCLFGTQAKTSSGLRIRRQWIGRPDRAAKFATHRCLHRFLR